MSDNTNYDGPQLAAKVARLMLENAELRESAGRWKEEANLQVCNRDYWKHQYDKKQVENAALREREAKAACIRCGCSMGIVGDRDWAAENAALKDEIADLINGREYQAMQKTLAEVNERLAAAESKEVCTVAHSDEVLEGER